MDKNKIEFFIWRFLETIIKFAGLKRIPFLARLLSGLFFYLIPIRKNVVVSNLQKAFPEKAENEINRLARRNYQSVAQTFMELLLISNLSKEEVSNLVVCENIELVEQKISIGRGVLFVTGHFGNWELAALWGGLTLSTLINVLVVKQRNHYVADWMTKLREKFGNREITVGVSIRELIKNLNDGGLIGIVGDQRGPRDGVRVTFFNQPTMTFQGFAVLALKNQVPIIVANCLRSSNGKYIFEFEEINFDNLPEKNSEAVQELNQRYMSLMENAIRKAPDQYLWMHNIWKYQ